MIDYERKRNQAAERDREISASGRDIGLKHPSDYNAPHCGCKACGGLRVLNQDRRDECRLSLKKFALAYRPEKFFIENFSVDHEKVIAKMEQAVLRGGLFSVAMPRGSGKTTLAETAVLWSLLYGHHMYVMLIGADKKAALQLLKTVKTELEANDTLLEDFPEACYPIRCIGGISHRCRGQLFLGESTRISWKSDEIQLPTIKGSDSSGALCESKGITGGVRGRKVELPNGKSLRPSLVIVDDPQTRKSAKSTSLTTERMQIVNGDILGLAGPGQKISGIMPCTVIQQGDLADQVLDRKISPEWQGERTQMLYAFPKNMKLWDRYAELQSEGLEAGDGGERATEFYRQNREAMDEGAEVAWPERFNPDEISGIQHAMNLWIRNPEVFAAEYQNDPIDPNAIDQEELLTADEIARKVSGYKRAFVPEDAEKITSFIDIQAKVFYWAVMAWTMDFQGWILDYGAYPGQGVKYYTLSTLKKTLAQKYPGAHLTGRIRLGLRDLINELGARTFKREDGNELGIDRLLVDCGWEPETGTVRKAIGEADFARVWPSMGRGIKASDRPMGEWSRKRGDRVGQDWRVSGGRSRHVLFDSNAFKTTIQAGLATAPGDPGCIQLFKGSPHVHRMLAEHLSAEYPVETEGRGRKIKEWKNRPGRDNHLLDGVVGCAVGASIEGCKLITEKKVAAKSRQRERVSYLNV